MAFAIEWLISIYQMWFYRRLPGEIRESGGYVA